MKSVDQELADHIRNTCSKQARYRILWIVGEPRSGKTSISKQICNAEGWKYINFTLDQGFLDNLIGREEIYRPNDFLEDLYRWCNSTIEEFIIFDEIEPLLSLWLGNAQEEFFKLIGRSSGLQRGIAIVTHSRTIQQLNTIFPEMNKEHIYEIRQGANL